MKVINRWEIVTWVTFIFVNILSSIRVITKLLNSEQRESQNS
jgi:hypothetical protein